MLNFNPDAHISTIGARYYKLCRVLDEDSRWESLLEALPYNDCNELERLARDAENRPDTSPAGVLLQRLSSKGVTVGMMKEWLREQKLEKALFFLQEDVPLRVVKQPSPYMVVEEGQELVLEFQAEAFPDPEYQWFKDNGENELVGEIRSILRIPHVQLKDAGTYVCRVHTVYMNERVDHDFSNHSTVLVVPSVAKIMPSDPSEYMPQQKEQPVILSDNIKVVNDTEGIPNMQICRSHYENISTTNTVQPDTFVRDLQIIKYPVSPGKVNQGSTVVLECKAQSSLPVHYQWYCKGMKMPGETSPELKLSNLYIDTYTGEYYHCEVFTELENLHSSSVSYQLNGFDDSTQYFATDKVALLMANNLYDNLENLKTPTNDAATLSSQLKSIGFKVICLMNLNLNEMKKAVYVFCESLSKGSYGLVYCAGHGFMQFGQSYFQPVNASDIDLTHECVCIEEILEHMQKKELALSLLLIDMCCRLPIQFREGKKSIQPGKIYEPAMKRNVIYGYATSFLCAAYENKRTSHGYFMKYLKEHITKNEAISDILWRVKCCIEHDPDVHDRQYSWVASSLTARRKLTDHIINDTALVVTDDVNWHDLQSSPFHNIRICFPYLDASVVLEFCPHKEEFCNAVDMYLHIEAENEKTLAIISHFNFDFKFNLEDFSSKRVELNTFSGLRICCCVMEIFDLQKIKGDFTGTLRISHRQTGKEIAKCETLPFAQPPVSRLRCREFWQRHSKVNEEDASHGLIMNLLFTNICDVQSHYKNEHEDRDLISFTDEITSFPSVNDK